MMVSSSSSNPSSCDSTSAAAKEKAKEKKVKLSTDPQSVAARQRRHRISHRFQILRSLVPGGSKMDTVSMLEEAIQYVKFLKNQIWLLHHAMINFVGDPSFSSSQPDSCGVLPFDRREFDFYYNYDEVDCGRMELPESWFSGEENWAMQR